MAHHFPATRTAGMQKLSAFAPNAGRHYAAGRNTDNGPEGHAHVSLLSPYVRHRLVTEREVAQAVLSKHSFAEAEKFIQEVLWRTYWKGWLEMRPTVWTRFVDERDRMRDMSANSPDMIAAEAGATGIDCFDEWVRELVDTGYLHNHARMWFASIWIFTLRLPWTLGADFFLRHLMDADAASNTLSWRWVAGLQTAGKTYLATADNIARFTGGRFSPKGLAVEAIALTEPAIEAAATLPDADVFDDRVPSLLLVTPEDMSPETVFSPTAEIVSAVVATASGLSLGDRSARFVAQAADDTTARVKAHFRCDAAAMCQGDVSSLVSAAEKAGVRQIMTPYAPVGPVADALRTVKPDLADGGVVLCQIKRSWDSRFWPHATKGFFPFKAHIQSGLADEGIRQR
jgi:deoxyribodipyrimidine photo-lyase